MEEDRLDKLGSGFASQLLAADGKPLLASLTTVTDLLRAFVSTAVDRRADYLAGKPEAANAMEADSTDAKALGDLLNGAGPKATDFFVQPWNSPDQMGRFLVDTYAMACAPEDAAYCVLLGMLGEAYAEVDFATENGNTPEDAGDAINGVIETYAHALLGMEDPNDEE